MADINLGDGGTSNRKSNKRKRIRRLVELDEPAEGRKRPRRESANIKTLKVERCSKNVFITCLLISLSLTILFGNYFALPPERRKDGLISSFINNYRNHYNQIVHGKKNYCEDNLDSAVLTENIQKEQIILHQKEALQELQWTMEQKRQRIFIALVGPVGVGKSLYVDALQKHFPWPENVHSFLWNTYVKNENEKYQTIRVLIEYFSDCGVNLLIIKNLTPLDKPLINVILEMIKEQPNARRTRVIVIFIFNLNSMVSETEIAAQYHSLQKLNHTKTINFKGFGKKELADCIRRESNLENVTLSHNTFQELLDTIDVKRSGCKNVNAKVLAFGKKLNKSKPTKDEEMLWTK